MEGELARTKAELESVKVELKHTKLQLEDTRTRWEETATRMVFETVELQEAKRELEVTKRRMQNLLGLTFDFIKFMEKLRPHLSDSNTRLQNDMELRGSLMNVMTRLHDMEYQEIIAATS